MAPRNAFSFGSFALASRSFNVGAIFSRIVFAAVVSCCAHSGWLWLIASPQYAITNVGSIFCARWNATAASSN